MNVTPSRLIGFVVLLAVSQNVTFAQESTETPSVSDESTTSPSQGATIAFLPVAGGAPQVFSFSGSTTGSISTSLAQQSLFDLVGHPSVTKDLEIVDDQLAQVSALQEEYGKQITAQMEGLRDGSITGDEYTALLIAQKANRKKRLNEILLPHQLKRLNQISFQLRTKGISNFSGDKFDKSVAEKLGLSAEQQNQLRDKSREITKRLEAEFKRMRAEAKEELLGVLTVDQRAKFSELSGSKYEENAGDWNEYIKKHNPKKN